MNELENCPGSIIDKAMLLVAVAKFLRTHERGGQRLMEWLDSVPPDRTEEEYAQLRKQWDEEEESLIRARLDEINAAQRARGGNQIDRRGNIIAGPGAPRNPKQTERARTDRQQIAGLLRNKPRLTAKQILQILGWPLSKLRAVERHIKAIRDL